MCERSETKLEYVAGVVVAMARGSYNHAALLSRFGARLDPATAGGSCRSFTDSLSVYVAEFDSIRAPNAVVACPPNVINASQGMIDNPTVLVEVTSPSSRETDRANKLREYASVSSLRHYVLVDSERVMVELFSRAEDGTWRFELMLEREEILRLPAIGFELPLAELYEGVQFGESATAL